MQFLTIHLTDAQLLTLAKITLSPGGVASNGNAMAAAGVYPGDAQWLGENGYLETELRELPGGAGVHLVVTEKGRRELRLRFS